MNETIKNGSNSTKKPSLSVVIRTYNEEKWLGETLKSLRNQTVKDIEIIIVDSGSTDKTLEISEEYDATIYKIPKSDFTYPYALNYGISRANADFIGILSGHSVPVSERWAENAIRHFEDENIAGVVGFHRPLPDAKLWDKALYRLPAILAYNSRIKLATNFLDNRNSLIRKSLWEEYNFNLELSKGCEDYDWSWYMTKYLNYKILWDSRCQVMHSHSGIGKKSDLELWWTTWRFETKKIRVKYKKIKKAETRSQFVEVNR